jgi:hypothetical protein
MSLLFLSPLKKVVSGGAFTPGSLSSLKLWLDMNKTSSMTFSSSNNIQTVTDLSSSGIVSTLYSGAGASAQQVAAQLNGLAVWHSNTKSAYSFSAAPYDNATSNGWSKYFIMRFNYASAAHAWFYNFTDTNNATHTPANTSYMDNSTANGLAWMQQNGLGKLSAPRITDTTSFHVIEVHYTGAGNGSSANYSIIVDHVSQTLTTGGGDWVYGNGYGGYDTANDTGNWGNVDFAAIVDCSPVLSSTDKTKMTSWISSTYGL